MIVRKVCCILIIVLLYKHRTSDDGFWKKSSIDLVPLVGGRHPEVNNLKAEGRTLY